MNNPPLHSHTAEAILGRMAVELTDAGRVGIAAWGSMRAQLSDLPHSRPEHIVVTGCGDSYYAGLATRHLIERLTGVPTVVVPSMEAIAFPSPLMNERCLLVGVSVSGRVERTIEAVQAHRRRGGATVAITALADNPLADEADFVLTTGLRGTPGPVPGTANYLGSLLGLVAVAKQIESHSDLAAVFTDQEVVSVLGRIDAGLVARARRVDLAERMQFPFFALGTGPDFGAANYGVAKFLEAGAAVGVAQDLEEWAHEQYFATREGTTVFVLATTSETTGRAKRLVQSINAVGGTPILIGPVGDLGAADYIPLPTTPAILSPFVSWVPFAALALTYSEIASRAPFGIDGPERMTTVDNDIYVAGAVDDER